MKIKEIVLITKDIDHHIKYDDIILILSKKDYDKLSFAKYDNYYNLKFLPISYNWDDLRMHVGYK